MLSLLDGIRVGEIASLRVSDAYEADGTVRDQIRLSAKHTKGGEGRTVLLNERMQDELRSILHKRGNLSIIVPEEIGG